MDKIVVIEWGTCGSDEETYYVGLQDDNRNRNSPWKMCECVNEHDAHEIALAVGAYRNLPVHRVDGGDEV